MAGVGTKTVQEMHPSRTLLTYSPKITTRKEFEQPTSETSIFMVEEVELQKSRLSRVSATMPSSCLTRDETDSDIEYNNEVIHILSYNMYKGITHRRFGKQHLVIHLKHGAINSSLVQYRWMKLISLKKMIRSKARVEGCIIESYLIETRHNNESRSFASDIPSYSRTDDRLSIFKVPSHPLFDKGRKQKS
ncbi:hypothetical protein OSB04_006476 [Centaurea solstitialis]|uniref:DUF4218 domain-containing protein n=1 Tax=Centaurea solstitialis TaxID=347529 RepID=A0AA38TVT4_9ASTR|nr:hypothetical protein OSB04_006476 [Centaurea solstitialis]